MGMGGGGLRLFKNSLLCLFWDNIYGKVRALQSVKVPLLSAVNTNAAWTKFFLVKNNKLDQGIMLSVEHPDRKLPYLI